MNDLAFLWHKFVWNVSERGPVGTAEAAASAVLRAFQNAEHLLVVDCARDVIRPASVVGGAVIEPVRARAELAPSILRGIRAQICKRRMPDEAVDRYVDALLSDFDRGAVLWTALVDGEIAGYHWAMGASADYASEFPLFPLAARDHIVFAGYVYPSFRGRGILAALLSACLLDLQARGCARVYTRVKVWNSPSLSSVRKVGFRDLARCRLMTLLGRRVVVWAPPSVGGQPT